MLGCAPAHRATENTSTAPQSLGALIIQDVLPGWKRLDVKGKVTLSVPHDMKPVAPFGDSYSYREAYRKRQINVTIVYGEPFVPLTVGSSPFLLPSCDASPSANNSHFLESFVVVDGRKGKMTIDRSQEKNFIDADICFPKTARNEAPFQIIAYSQDEHALEIVQQIFSSIRFKD